MLILTHSKAKQLLQLNKFLDSKQDGFSGLTWNEENTSKRVTY